MSAPRPVFAVVAAAAMLAPGTALAHSAVIGTSPAEGSTLTSAPARATVTFNEPIRQEFVYARLVSSTGTETPTTVSVTGPDLVASFDHPLPDGAYTLSYRVASKDTHPVSGAVHFTVKAATSVASPTSIPATTSPTATATVPATPAPSASTATQTESGSTGPVYWTLLTLAGIAVAVGGWFAGRRARTRRR